MASYTSFTMAIFITLFHQSLMQQVETNPEVLVVKSIQSLEKAVTYFVNRQSNVATNELLGLRIATVALLKAVDNCVGSPGVSVPNPILENVKLLCARLNVLMPRILNIYNPTKTTQSFKNFFSGEFKGFRSYRSINVEKESRKALETLEGVVVEDYQLCLGDLMQMGDSACTISDNCWKVLQPKIAEGSSIPYQAMVLVTLEVLGCSSEVNKKWDVTTIEELADNICYSLYPKVSAFHASDILQEEEQIQSFLEAFFACSLLGFDDFLQVTHLRIPAVVRWQLPSGCFGIATNAEDGTRSAEKCVPHMSSAAIGQLGLYLKWLMDPKGYAASTGNQPFKTTTWMLPIKILIVIAILLLFFVRKVRRALWGGVFGKVLAFFRSFRNA